MVTRKTLKENIWMIALIAGVASVPLFTDYVLEGSSLVSTLSQIEAVGQGLGRAFPVRMDLNGCLEQGNLAVAFQANVIYLFPALLHLAGMGLGSAYKWTLLLLNLATAAIAFGCFEKCSRRREIGIMGSLLYTWCPYRCSDMYLVGDLGTTAAWAFLPVIVLGLKLLYTEDREQESYGRSWVVLTWGFTLLAVSSVTFFTVGLVLAALTLFAMGKETLRRETMAVLGKTALAVMLLNAWFLVPVLLYLKDASVTGAMLVRDMRRMGMFPTQYLAVFSWGGDGINTAEEGMRSVQAMGPGIAVILLVFVYLGALFTGRLRRPMGMAGEKDREWHFAGREMCVCAILIFLSTNLFPWDLFENRNLLFSIVLALIHTPAKLGAAANIGLILVSCLLFQRLSEHIGEKEYRLLLLAAGAVSFGTTQFLLGNILVKRQFVRQEEIAGMGTLQLPLMAQEPVVWRVMEGISIVALCGCIIMWIIRRRNSGKRV